MTVFKNKGVWLATVMFVLTVAAMTGCRAQKQQSETREYVSDTLWTSRRDTVSLDRESASEVSSQKYVAKVGQSYALSAETIPLEMAHVQAPLAALSVLPEGSGYSASNGRASVQAVRSGDTLEITATCDSVTRQLEYWTDLCFEQFVQVDSLRWELERMSQVAAESKSEAALYRRCYEEVRKNPPNSIRVALAGLGAGVVLAAGVFIMYNHKK